MIRLLLPPVPLASRCFCCGARAFAPLGGAWLRCTWCDMQHQAEGADPAGVKAGRLEAMITGAAAAGPAGSAGRDWRATHRSLAIAASTLRRWYHHGDAPPDALIAGAPPPGSLPPFDAARPKPVSLVLLARAADRALEAQLDRYEGRFSQIVAMLDAPAAPPRERQGVRLVTRPLAGDFAGQRNAGNRAATGEWVFHLDMDERVSDGFCAVLPHLAGAAAADGLTVLGFPRRNIVSGALSDLFPDIQYRLMRRDVRFEGRVHERPAPCRSGRGTSVSQHGAIDHFLDLQRVRGRSRLYDRLGQDPARRADDIALLAPFRG